MVGFYCVTLFHIFLSVLLKHKYYKNLDAVIYIANPLSFKDIDSEALLKCGFTDVIQVDDDKTVQGRNYTFQSIMFYSLYSSCHNYLKSLPNKKLILVYEGITTCQLNQWNDGDSVKRFDLDKDIHEFWLPNSELLLDEEYLPRCKEFSVAIDDMSANELSELCDRLNAVFRYDYQPVNGNVLFMDRYLMAHGNFVLSTGVENILTQSIYYGIGGKFTIKKHPYDKNYMNKYKGLSNAEIIEKNVPWELIYLNNKLHNSEFGIDTYIIYNSFAPANLALLFGDNHFKCICVEPILDKYTDIENTYLNSRVTDRILNRFAQICGVEVKFVNGIEEFNNKPEDIRYSTDDILWKNAEKALKDKNIDNLLEIRAFRLQIDCALISLKKKTGKYHFNVDNSSAEISRKLLQIALPQFVETEDKKESDIIIDCNGTLVDYTKDDFDVRHFSVIEGCFRLNELESEIEIMLKNVDSIYIWGVTKTNIRTFNMLKKLNLSYKIKKVFDSYATGNNHGYPIVRFSPELLEKNSFIFVCAAVAYQEIAQILKNYGYIEGIDFAIGVGIENV